MGIENIEELMPAPISPKETQGHDWEGFSKEMSSDVPALYKDFLSVYGTGVIGGFLWVINPFSSNSNLNIEKIKYFHEAYGVMKELFPEDYPRDVCGDFITWAVTDNGDSFFWLVDDGLPDAWEVGIYSKDQGEEELTGMATLEFFIALLEKRVSSSILCSDFLESDKKFVSY